MRDIKNKLTIGKNTKDIQSRKGKSFGYQILGFGSAGAICTDFICAFRDAYHMIKNKEVDVSTNDSFENFSYGSPFNLAIEDIESRFIELKKLILS